MITLIGDRIDIDGIHVATLTPAVEHNNVLRWDLEQALAAPDVVRALVADLEQRDDTLEKVQADLARAMERLEQVTGGEDD
jgi:2-C-methyl-D-erythritol 4-phosphate cytidylyltransferase